MTSKMPENVAITRAALTEAESGRQCGVGVDGMVT